VGWNIIQWLGIQLSGMAYDSMVRHTGKWDGICVRYHSGGSMKLNACILLLAHMVYL
jgi:hypothetical protein